MSPPALPSRLRQMVLLLSAVLTLITLVRAAPVPSEKPATSNWPGADLFTNGALQMLELEISATNLTVLKQDPRTFVRATLMESSVSYQDVAVHLKGSVGSFRELDDKPAFTLDFSRFHASQRFHGLRRLHLNNSVEDPSYANEQLGSQLFRRAGVPAPRVGHAVVRLNGRRLGLYVLKEGFTEDFLGCYFKSVGGNLYEPGEGHDVNQSLKRNSVHAPTAVSILDSLAQAALEPEPARRWQRLNHTLDMDEFLRFMALEIMLCHRDGYSLARNNFRVYQNPETGKIMFFPHGMDQLFGRTDLPWQPRMSGLVAKAVMDTPQGLQLYREVFANLFTNLFVPDKLGEISLTPRQLRPSLTPQESAGLEEQTTRLKERILQRQRFLAAQLSQPQLTLLTFTNDAASLNSWDKAEEPADGALDLVHGVAGAEALHILARADTVASWRAKALLAAGRYRFEGRTRVAGVKPLPFGRRRGADLRTASTGQASPGLVGDAPWQTLSTEFTVTDGPALVECVCELRASSGEAWFELPSLKIIRINP